MPKRVRGHSGWAPLCSRGCSPHVATVVINFLGCELSLTLNAAISM